MGGADVDDDDDEDDDDDDVVGRGDRVGDGRDDIIWIGMEGVMIIYYRLFVVL